MKILCTQTNRNRLCDGCGDTASDNRCRACYDESRGIPDPVEASQQQFLESLGPLVAPIEIEDDLSDVYSGDAGLAEMKEKHSITFEAWYKLCGKVRSTYQDIETKEDDLPAGAVVHAEFRIGVDMGQDRDHSVIAIAGEDLQKGDLVVGQEIDRDYAAILAPIEEGLLKSNQDIIDDMLAAIKVDPSAVYSYETFADIHPPSPLNIRCGNLPYIEPLYSKELPTKPGVYSVRYKSYDCLETMEVKVKETPGGHLIVEDPRIIKGELNWYTVLAYQLMGAEWLFVRDLGT